LFIYVPFIILHCTQMVLIFVISIALSEVCNVLILNVFEVSPNKEPIGFF